MQQRSQIPKADNKTTIKALMKGLTPGPTASHLTRKKPKTIDELFHELEEYILSDDDHRKRVAERNEARQGNREITWRPQPQNPRNINSVENPQPNQNNTQEEDLHLGSDIAYHSTILGSFQEVVLFMFQAWLTTSLC
jgi:hypothetical protein